MNIILKIVSWYKKRKFLKYAILEDNVTIGYTANILSSLKNSISIGRNSYIHANLVCSKNGKINIGNYCSIRYKTIIESEANINIGNYVIISNNVVISDNNSHSVCYLDRQKMLESGEYGKLWNWDKSNSGNINIKDNVWIGRNVFVLKGVTIGEGAIVAAGSVVTKNIPPFSLAYGNPCQIKEGKYKFENS